MQQSDLLNHSTKSLTYLHDLDYITFYINCILTTYYVWGTNEIFYSQSE